MSKPKLIGLTGYKGSGKDTVALVLNRYGYQRVAFADPLKAIAAVLGWNGDKAETPRCEHCGMLQGRELLQVLGTEGVRENIRDDAWLLAAERAISHHDLVVITDVRFPNEAEFVRAHGGEVWRVIRPGHAGDGHASETSQKLIRADLVLNNHGSLADLEDTVIWAIEAKQALPGAAAPARPSQAICQTEGYGPTELDPGLSVMVNS